MTLAPSAPARAPRIGDRRVVALLRNYSTSPAWASLATAAWIVLVDNNSFWRTFVRAQDSMNASVVATTTGVALVLIFAFSAVLRPFALRRLGTPLLAALLVVSAGVAHYVDVWGVLFDKGLIRNMVQTDMREVRELASWPALLDVAWRGLLPATLLLFSTLRASSLGHTLGQTLGLAFVAALMAAALLATSYGILASTFRNHRELRFQLVPTNYLNAVYGYLKGSETKPSVLTRIAPDAERASSAAEKPLVLVLIVGETARAANFSLGGYERDTNAALAGSGALYFDKVVSCGTDTATSLPCMFSDLGVDAFSVAKAPFRENVLDVLQRTGVGIEWIDNNSGCKGVCARVPTQQLATTGAADLCSDGACLDEVLVTALDSSLNRIERDSAIVLHQMGSHGPAYFKRYPAPGRFQPTCNTNRIQGCDKVALVNTYDNSIDYTSQVVAAAIAKAKSQQVDMDIAVVYVSDHGESLGERNIYLHGLPTLLAPAEQTRVPMLAWLSDGAQRRLRVSSACLAAVAASPLSHDNLYSTLLGFFSVQSTSYKAQQDLWAMARADARCTSK